MTIIFSNMGDTDCQTLPLTYEGLPNVKVVEVTRDTRHWRNTVNEAIATETDTILFLGHGTPDGLLSPNWEDGIFLLDAGNVHLIRARNVYCCWCYASAFCETYGLHAFATSMFISNTGEAYYCGISEIDSTSIHDQNERYMRQINGLLRADTPMSEWLEPLTAATHHDDPVDDFNRSGLRYFE